MLKGIFLDIDGVITDLSHFHFLAWASIFSQHGIKITNKQWKVLNGKPRLDIAKGFVRLNGSKMGLKEIEDIAHKKNALFVHFVEHGLRPSDVANGICQLIIEAKKKGYKLIVASHSSNAILQMQRLGLYEKFDYVNGVRGETLIASNKTKHASLSPTALALEKMGLEGEECIGFENEIDGIREYQSSGVFSVGVTHFDQEIKIAADFAVDLPEQINLDEVVFNYYKSDKGDEESI